MKYLYYTLYLFYVKIIHVHNDWPPIISITGVMSFLFTALIFLFYSFYEYLTDEMYLLFDILLWCFLILLFYKLLYDYYKPREAKLLKEMDNKPLWIKIIIVLISVGFIILVVKLWMFDGRNSVYKFIKEKLYR